MLDFANFSSKQGDQASPENLSQLCALLAAGKAKASTKKQLAAQQENEAAKAKWAPEEEATLCEEIHAARTKGVFGRPGTWAVSH